jgi:hypothetical protein
MTQCDDEDRCPVCLFTIRVTGSVYCCLMLPTRLLNHWRYRKGSRLEFKELFVTKHNFTRPSKRHEGIIVFCIKAMWNLRYLQWLWLLLRIRFLNRWNSKSGK